MQALLAGFSLGINADHISDNCITIHFAICLPLSTAHSFRVSRDSIYPFNSYSLHWSRIPESTISPTLLSNLHIHLHLFLGTFDHVIRTSSLLIRYDHRDTSSTPSDLSKVPFIVTLLVSWICHLSFPWRSGIDGWILLHGIHGLIPEGPRPSTSRSIARLLIPFLFLDVAYFLYLRLYLYLYVYPDVDVCIIFRAYLNPNVGQPAQHSFYLLV